MTRARRQASHHAAAPNHFNRGTAMNVQTEYSDDSAEPVEQTPTIRARFSMIAVAYGAKSGAIDPAAIDRCGQLVFETFGADHELTREIEHFIDTVTSSRGDQEVWTAAGDRLKRAVERTTWTGARREVCADD